MKKTWDRGRKKLTASEKRAAEKKQRIRMKISNMVARKQEIDNRCCICGNKGSILHNIENPYYISFLCKECRKNPDNIKIAELNRFDIREKFDKANLNTGSFTDDETKQLVRNYANSNDTMSIGEYCMSVGISRHQFNRLIDRYAILYPRQPIYEMIKNKSHKCHNMKIKKTKEERLF